MALIGMDGFEAFPQVKPEFGGNGSPVLVTGRDGLGKAISGSVTAGTPKVFYALPSAPATLILGMGIRWHSGIWTGGVNSQVIALWGDANVTQHLTVMVDGTGHLELKRGNGSSGTLLATSTLTLPSADAWVYLEIKATLSDTVGACEVRVDGVQFINVTGVDTKNAGTATVWSGFSIGTHMSSGVGNLYDDIYYADDTGSAPYNNFLGDVVIKALRPDGNGANSDFVGTDANSTDNYLLVDEVAADTLDYVKSATATHRDLYTFTDLVTSAVIAVQFIMYAQKSDGGSRSIKALLRSAGGAVTSGATQALSTSWRLHQGTLRTDDADGIPWTNASLNAHQFGFENV